jgi:hypothetical protein
MICGKNALPDGLRCCSVECGQIAEEQEAQMESLNDDEIPFWGDPPMAYDKIELDCTNCDGKIYKGDSTCRKCGVSVTTEQNQELDKLHKKREVEQKLDRKE